MIKTLLAAGASALALTLATPVLAEDAGAPAVATDAAAGTQGKAAIGDWGVDLNLLDSSIDPGDDFFAYVNRKALDAIEIPAQYSYAGTVLDLRLGSERDVHEIVEELAAGEYPQGSLEQRVGDTYSAYLDTDTIEARGMAPLQPYLSEIYAAKNLTELARFMAKPGMPGVFGGFVINDQNDPTINGFYFGMGGLGLPDRDTYLVDNERNLALRKAYVEYLTELLDAAGYADPAAAAKAVYSLEHEMAKVHWDRALSRNPVLTNNVVTPTELQAMAPEFPMDAFFDELGIAPGTPMIVGEILPDDARLAASGLSRVDLLKLGDGVPGMMKLLAHVPLSTVQAWTAAHLIDNFSDVLPRKIDDASFAFYGKAIQGKTEQRARWQRAISNVEGVMGEAIGKIYVQRHFPESSKAKMKDLVDNLLAAMGENLKDLEWMTPATRVAAREKLDAFVVKIGYPEKFETYDGLAVVPGDAVANSVAANVWSWNDQLSDLGQPVDKGKWLFTPQTVNAYYMPPANEIVFPAGYLQPPMFDPNADPAVNYGAVGTTIGHEIGHGFDDSGSHYDGTGALRDWWTEEDRAAFDALGKSLIEQYNNNCPYENACHNGLLTLGENIGDISGLSLAYKAYQMSLGGKEAPVIDGLTGDQRFFLAFAQAERWKYREPFARTLLETDPHSLAEARINETLRNFDPWYKAFNVTEDNKLYLPPEKRVRIW